jgi:phage FluMu protein Com
VAAGTLFEANVATDILYRCSTCNRVTCAAELRVTPGCPNCNSTFFFRAPYVTDAEMADAIKRGFKYDAADFEHVQDEKAA